jgi:hypothetical protein
MTAFSAPQRSTENQGAFKMGLFINESTIQHCLHMALESQP